MVIPELYAKRYIFSTDIIYNTDFLNFFFFLRVFPVTNDDPSLSAKLGGQNNGIKIQRRSFYLRLVRKAVSRGEQPGLELVYVSGCLLILPNSGIKRNILLWRLYYWAMLDLKYNFFT